MNNTLHVIPLSTEAENPFLDKLKDEYSREIKIPTNVFSIQMTNLTKTNVALTRTVMDSRYFSSVIVRLKILAEDVKEMYPLHAIKFYGLDNICGAESDKAKKLIKSILKSQLDSFND